METCCLVRAKLPAFWFPGIFRALRAANIWDLPKFAGQFSISIATGEGPGSPR
jgi:hypothetical protein